MEEAKCQPENLKKESTPQRLQICPNDTPSLSRDWRIVINESNLGFFMLNFFAGFVFFFFCYFILFQAPIQNGISRETHTNTKKKQKNYNYSRFIVVLLKV